VNQDNELLRGESDRRLDRAIRAVIAEPAPKELRNRLIQTALGSGAGGSSMSRHRLLERVTNMIQTHKRLSVAASAAVAALAAGLALALSLVSPAGQV
jgi:hypothetical protein